MHLNPLVYVLVSIEVITCIAAIVNYEKLLGTFWITLPFFFFLIVCQDAYGYVLNSYHLIKLNQQFYQYFACPFNFSFYYWLFYKNLTKTKFKLLPIFFIVLLIGSVFLDAYLHPFDEKTKFLSASQTIANLFLLVLIVVYFYTIIKNNTVFYYKTNLFFWICIGLLVFYIGSSPYFGLLNYLAIRYMDLCIVFQNVVLILNCCMYIIFTIGLFKCKFEE